MIHCTASRCRPGLQAWVSTPKACRRLARGGVRRGGRNPWRGNPYEYNPSAPEGRRRDLLPYRPSYSTLFSVSLVFHSRHTQGMSRGNTASDISARHLRRPFGALRVLNWLFSLPGVPLGNQAFGLAGTRPAEGLVPGSTPGYSPARLRRASASQRQKRRNSRPRPEGLG